MGTLHSEAARDHLWMHFTRHSVFEDRTEGRAGHLRPDHHPGRGHKIWDDRGNEYIDGLAGLFVVQVGHGPRRLAETAARRGKETAFFPLWSYAHPRAIEPPSAWRPVPPATSTASSSPREAARPSRRPGSWPSSTRPPASRPTR